ncbi:sigma-54-dependent Fis family transcriptional regulator [Aureimonas sp. N4]|uniref:sigma-54-dependent Fis family transcriptional regulator n=1 Tax=Aureimonas sp. N4 TaxID=1638165 RepID=UPI00078504A7|nr:sigma-54-dependent Fis family transcriptional regulator [Aureimonas sp. N4]
MAIAAAHQHIHEIETVALGAASRRDEVVSHSWRRCIETYRLDPSRACEAYILPELRLREHRQRSEDLIRTARFGLETLHGQMAGQGYVLLLADALGVTVDFIGDPTFDNQLRRAGLYLGSEWSEPRAGTCAVGSCLATGEALCIHQSDHFDLTHTPLTCSAAPIYDTDGTLAAVLDISALRSPEAKISQNLVLHLVSATARRIELANLMASARGEWVIRFSRSPEFLDVDPDGAVSLDASGRVAGLTHAAQKLLAGAVGVDWRDPGAVLGRPIGDFLQLGLDDLPDLTRDRPSESRLLAGRDGNRVFAHAIAPPRASPRALKPSPGALPPALADLSGGDPAMDTLLAKAARLARAPLSILLQGETGTGKEVLARAIHRSRGDAKPFVALNCAALPESLIEAELFGHAPSAFTGASAKGRPGLIEAANGGTLFLDEIGDMPLSLQSRLLRVLSEREIVPVGALKPISLDIRVMSASHRDLGALVRQGAFREDLFYRLNAATLRLPPLRERQDLGWLIERLGGGAKLDPAARAALLRHVWPGNVRELRNALELGAALAEDGTIRLADLPEALGEAQPQPWSVPSLASDAPPAQSEAEDAETLRALLLACRWNVSEAARRLGCDRTTVHRRMRRLGLAQPQ